MKTVSKQNLSALLHKLSVGQQQQEFLITSHYLTACNSVDDAVFLVVGSLQVNWFISSKSSVRAIVVITSEVKAQIGNLVVGKTGLF